MSEQKDWKTIILRRALAGQDLTPDELLEMMADRRHWHKIYDDDGCHWAWCGPFIPPWEMAARVLRKHKSPNAPSPLEVDPALPTYR